MALIGNKKPQYTLNKDFFNHDTPEVFYVAGFIAADGCVHQKRKHKIANGANYLTLLLKEEDRDHLDKIRQLIGWSKPLDRKINKNSKINSKYKDRVQYYFQIGSTDLCKSLLRFNINERKSLTYSMPEWLISHKYLNYFLLGYFDGDGCISFSHKNKQLQIHIAGTEIFLSQFNDILIKNNLCKFTNKRIYRGKGIHMLGFNGINKCIKIYEFLSGDNIIYLKRKHDVYQMAKNIKSIT